MFSAVASWDVAFHLDAVGAIRVAASALAFAAGRRSLARALPSALEEGDYDVINGVCEESAGCGQVAFAFALAFAFGEALPAQESPGTTNWLAHEAAPVGLGRAV